MTVPDDWPTIQQAIDSGADTILVRPGTYPETPVLARLTGSNKFDDVFIGGLVPAGSSPDSLPEIEGFMFDSLDPNGIYVHSPSITISDLRFSRAVQNRFHTAPYSNPLVINFTRCVLDSGLTDVNATVGGQLEYYVRNCQIKGPINLAHPERMALEMDEVLAPVTLQSDMSRLWLTGNTFRGPAPVGVYICGVWDGLDAMNNTFEGFQVPVRICETWASIAFGGNTFVGPGEIPVATSNNALCWFGSNRITGFETGILATGGSGDLDAYSNIFEQCGTAIRADVQYSNCDSNVVRSCREGVILNALDGLHATANVVQACEGDGMVLQAGLQAQVQSNIVGRCGGDGIRLVDGFLQANTVYRNGGAGLVLTHSGTLDHNIACENGRHGVEYSGIPSSILLGCNDWFGNSAGAVSGAEPGVSDLSLDPLFCDITQDDVHLSAGSPLLNAAGCGPIGALGQGCDAPIVSKLTTFTATATIEGVEVRWQVADTAPGFVAWLERADAAVGPWTRVESEPSSNGGVTVEYDRTAGPALSYWYRIVATDRGLTRALSDPILVETPPPTRFALLGTGQNPSPGAVEATFALAHAAAITLELFDAQGRRVATLAQGTWPAGVHHATWAGARPASGIYLIRYRHPGGEDLRRIAIVR